MYKKSGFLYAIRYKKSHPEGWLHNEQKESC